MSRTEIYRYDIATTDGADHRVPAAYYVHEDAFTIFKDDSGGILASFANDRIISIERQTTSVSNPDSAPDGQDLVADPSKATTINQVPHQGRLVASGVCDARGCLRCGGLGAVTNSLPDGI